MHPDRRRAGRAIRKQRRLARNPGYLATTLQGFVAAGAAVSAAFLGLGQVFATMRRMQEMQERLDMITHAYTYSPAPITLTERHDMPGTAVSITTSSTAPRDLLDHLVSFAQELEAEGITVDVALIRTCIACGCTDDEACFGGCSWISEVDDLCTGCDTPEMRKILADHATERLARIDELMLSITHTEAITRTNGA